MKKILMSFAAVWAVVFIVALVGGDGDAAVGELLFSSAVMSAIVIGTFAGVIPVGSGSTSHTPDIDPVPKNMVSCPHCGFLGVSPGPCPRCGKTVTWKVKKDNMISCPKCGFLGVGAGFCPKCGSSVTHKITPHSNMISCPDCGFLGVGSGHCPRCGKNNVRKVER